MNPPLRRSFRGFVNFSGRGSLRTMGLCQRCFDSGNLFRGRVCNNMDSLLRGLGRGKGALVITASGPRPFASEVVRRFGLTGCFSFVTNSGVSAAQSGGTRMVRCTLDRYGVGSGSGIMVVNSETRSVVNTRAMNISSVNMRCKCNAFSRLGGTNTACVIGAINRLGSLLDWLGVGRRLRESTLF